MHTANPERSSEPNPPDERDERFGTLYEEIVRIAHSIRQRHRADLLGTVSLVHEAFLRLPKRDGMDELPDASFRRLIAHAMQCVMVDSARRRSAKKRGEDREAVALDAGAELADTLTERDAEQIVALDETIQRIGRSDAERAEICRLFAFGGLAPGEIARQLEVSDYRVRTTLRAFGEIIRIDRGGD